MASPSCAEPLKEFRAGLLLAPREVPVVGNEVLSTTVTFWLGETVHTSFLSHPGNPHINSQQVLN